MRRCTGLLLFVLPVLGCATEALPLAPSAPALVPSHTLRSITCSDAAPRWQTRNFSTDRPTFTVVWAPQGGDGYTYRIVRHHSRDGAVPAAYVDTLVTTRTEHTFGDPQHGGRYYLQMQIVHGPCGDAAGAWSEMLTVSVDGPDQGSAPGAKACAYCHPNGIPGELAPNSEKPVDLPFSVVAVP